MSILICFGCPDIITDISLVCCDSGLDVLLSCLVHCPRSGTAPAENSSTPSNTATKCGPYSAQERSCSAAVEMEQSGQLIMVLHDWCNIHVIMWWHCYTDRQWYTVSRGYSLP